LGDPIVSGFFNLSISVNGYTYTSDFIPYDASAMMVDEVGYSYAIPGIFAYVTSGSAVVKASKDASSLVFINDRLQFSTQRFPGEIYTVSQVNSTHFTLNKEYLGAKSSSVTSKTNIFKYVGARGTPQSSKISCAADDSICSITRRQASGSIQAKLQMIPEALTLGVDVDRSLPDASNGLLWRVTFLDPSPSGPLNWNLRAVGNHLKTASGARANVTVTQLVSGLIYPNCTGTFVIPPDKTLTSGQYYYARVFAINEVGYSLPQVTTTSQKPMVPPGPPTSISLVVYSSTQLRVVFNPPASDGGDTITQYKVDYSPSSAFVNTSSLLVTYLAGGAPFFATISGLRTGTYYYVRVSAMNSQGYGIPTLSTPSSLNPYQSSQGPATVSLYPTSGTMITVAFTPPLDNGGDAIVTYRVEWDIVATFNSIMAAPNKGYVQISAQQYSSYTIQYLTQGQQYFVRVFAINSAGLGAPTYSSPPSVAPGLQVPGKPHTIYATSGANPGQISMSWQRPRVPWHSIPCSGTPALPNDCPTPIGGTLPASDGGTTIVEYAVSYNELEDFSGFDSGEITTTATTYTITNLTPGRTYYVRVLARNAQGAGLFCEFAEPNCLIVAKHVSAMATPTVV